MNEYIPSPQEIDKEYNRLFAEKLRIMKNHKSFELNYVYDCHFHV
jgi:hypothetical protein